MSFEQIQKDALDTYKENMTFLKTNNYELYKKINLLEIVLNTNIKKSDYELEYKDGYFDILNVKDNTFFYNKNSEVYGKELVDNHLSFDPKVSSFKTYYEVKYGDKVVDMVKNATMYSSTQISNAPVIHYVNENIPKKEELKTIPKLIIFGVGAGSHIPYLQLKVKAKIYLIIEPNLEIFRLSLFTIKYSILSKFTKIVFAVAQNENEFISSFSEFYNLGFIYNHYIKLFLFSKNCEFYTNIIQNQLLFQSHIIYSYDRLLKGLNKAVSYIEEDFQCLNIIHKKYDFAKKPILLLCAGPSLQRNIEFVKNNKDKFIIVALYVTLPLLEKHGIKPDVVTQYDEGADIVYNVIKRIKDISFFDQTSFVFASHLDKRVMNTFPKDNIFVFQAMFNIKVGFGAKTAPSIGELTYQLILEWGGENIYLLGMDMAMDVESKKTHIDGHASTDIYKQFKEENNNKHNLRTSIIKVKGNFLDEIDTLPLYKMSITSMNTITKAQKKKNVYVYNLSNGAYLEKIIPLKISDLKLDSFDILNKELEKEDILKAFVNNSETSFSENDIIATTIKVESANKLQDTLNEFLKAGKDSSLDVYENRLGAFIDKLVFEKSSCYELQSILKNYIMHNAHYIYHLINMRALDNRKRHVKNLNKVFGKQLNKIISTYVEIYSKVLEEK